VFFYRFCTDLVAELIVPPLTSMLMHKNSWIPLLLAVAFQGLSVILALSLPETLPTVDLQRSGEDTNEIFSVATSFGQEALSKSDGRWVSWFTRNKHLFDFVIKDKVLSALVVTFLISKVGRQSTNILFQYVSKRYGWTLAQVSLYSLCLSVCVWTCFDISQCLGRISHITTGWRKYIPVHSHIAFRCNVCTRKTECILSRLMDRQNKHYPLGAGQFRTVLLGNDNGHDHR
jgi:hypothetical protein